MGLVVFPVPGAVMCSGRILTTLHRTTMLERSSQRGPLCQVESCKHDIDCLCEFAMYRARTSATDTDGLHVPNRVRLLIRPLPILCSFMGIVDLKTILLARDPLRVPTLRAITSATRLYRHY